MSKSHSETRVLEYPFSNPAHHTKGYLRGTKGEGLVEGARQPCDVAEVRLQLLPSLLYIRGVEFHVLQQAPSRECCADAHADEEITRDKTRERTRPKYSVSRMPVRLL